MKKEAKFKVGELVVLKDFTTLVTEAKKYPYLMCRGELNNISEKQFAIYEVIPCAESFWYEIGQWGHYVIKVPETFIAALYQERVPEELCMSKEKLDSLYKQISEKVKERTALHWVKAEKFFNAVAQNKKRNNESDKENKDEGEILFPKINSWLNASPLDWERICCRSLDKKYVSKKEYTFESATKNIVLNIDKIKEKEYHKEYDNAHPALIEILYKHYSEIYQNEETCLILRDIAINAIFICEKYATLDYHYIIDKMISIYRKKNADYGNSFDRSLDEDGLLVAKIRIGDKIRRFITLTSDENRKAQVKDESIEDTLIDLANYCIMTIVYMKNNPNKN